MKRTLRVSMTLLLLIVFGVFLTGDFVSALPLIDQQQPVINTEAGVVVAIGGSYEQKLAQVVTAGVTGDLVEIRLAVACASGINLMVEIQGVSDDKPNGIILTSYTFTDVGGYTIPPTLKSLTFPTPILFSAGDRFAIVLNATPNPTYFCSTYPGPEGDPYPGGDGFFDSRPNPPGWIKLFYGPGVNAGVDLPFQTLVEPPLPDLIISFLEAKSVNTFSTKIRTIEVKYRVKNEGAASDPSLLYFYLSTDTVLSMDDVYVGSVDIQGLAVGEETPLESGTFRVVVSALKSWYLIAVTETGDEAFTLLLK